MPASILVLVGSLRATSTNRKLAEAVRDHAPDDVSVTIFDGLTDLPFYNEDADSNADVPASAQRFREAVTGADAVLIVTPEHNGTVPAVIKNAIDWGSRPYGDSSLSGKPVAVIGGAAGRGGGGRAHGEARRALTIAGANPLDEVDLSIPNTAARFTETHPRDDVEITQRIADVLNAMTVATS